MYYKRPDGKSKDWHGPARVIGTDSKIVFIRHGGQVLRVSPIHLRPVVDEPPHVPKNMKSKPQKSNRLYLSVQPSNEDVVQPNLSSDLLVDFDFDDLVLHILQT